MVRKRSLSMPKPDQATIDNPYSLFFPDDVRNQLSRIKKKDNKLLNSSGSFLKSSALTRNVERS